MITGNFGRTPRRRRRAWPGNCALIMSAFLFVAAFPARCSGQLPLPDELDRCHPNRTAKSRVCAHGMLLKAWPPRDSDLLSTSETAVRATVYLLAMVYLFLGVSIIADRFMASIEVITSKEKEIAYTKADGEQVTTTVRIWNETVSNLTLMALGSSAPEIMLSVIEICFKGFHAGELGPSTIVGSASFNLFIIIAICMYVIPDGETRKVKHPRVFIVTAVWSILAYFWLYFILALSSYGVVTILEGVITLLFFPLLVVLAWIADRRLLVYKYMHKRYRARRANIVIETEGEPEMLENRDKRPASFTAIHMQSVGDDDLNEAAFVPSTSMNGNLDDPEQNRKTMVRLMRDLRKKHPDADMAELAKLASVEALNNQRKSRAFYRIQATRMMTGAGNILNKKSDHIMTEEIPTDVLLDEDDGDVKIYFDPPEYKVMENCGFCEVQVVRRGGDLNCTVYVDLRTVDGTANAGSDYVHTEETIVFRPGESLRTVQIEILDDDIFEEDEYFRVELLNVRCGTPDGLFDHRYVGEESAILVAPAVATVVILDDDHAGVFSFPDPTITVGEGVGILKVEVQRNSGARGRVAVPYKTVAGSAKGGGEDFVDAVGELEFENDETSKHINVTIIDDEEYEKNKNFFVELAPPRYIAEQTYDSGTDGSDSGINGKVDEEESKLLTEEEEEARRIAELGKPRLGPNTTVEIMIEESYEFKNTVDKLIKKANLAVIVGTSSWREQFVDAISVNGGGGGNDDDDMDGDNESEPSFFDYVMHFLTVFWKLLFAFVPPTEYMGGFACFAVSIIVIGILTAIIGDVASHFGCVVNLNDEVTAVTLVAMGTSVPDTFASKVAAVGDQYADASIGNVTGSNAVNVFLGIGIAWTIAAVYWAVVGRTPEEQVFRVKPGNLAFSVTVFSVFALIAISVLMIRRRAKSVAAELGGPRRSKIASSLFFLLLWIVYIMLATLDSYCIIKTF